MCLPTAGEVNPSPLSGEHRLTTLLVSDTPRRLVHLHGSRANGTARIDSDIDLAAWFGVRPAPYAHDLDLPGGVDLLVLDRAPLEMAGRVALRGRLLHESDRHERVAWEARTRKIYADELPRITRAHQEFLASVASNGRR